MKRVYTNASDVIHLFAQRTQNEARCSNVFFDNKETIYSYGHHYNLATFLNNKAILINDSGYSSTTAKHIHIVTMATSQYKQFFYTKVNLDHIHSHVTGYLLPKLSNARKPELYLGPILSLWTSLNEYYKYMKVRNKKDPKYLELKRIVNTINKDKSNFTGNLQALQKRKAAAEKKRNVKNLKKQLKKFYNYESYNFHNCGLFDFVRISQDKTQIETSQNVKIDIKEAKILYLMIQANKDIKGHKIGYYTVISKNGTLKIGCHNIDMSSIHKTGKELLNL